MRSELYFWRQLLSRKIHVTTAPFQRPTKLNICSVSKLFGLEFSIRNKSRFNGSFATMRPKSEVIFVAILLAFALNGSSSAQTNHLNSLRERTVSRGLAATPPMGWNTWNRFGCNVSEELIKQARVHLFKVRVRAAGRWLYSTSLSMIAGSLIATRTATSCRIRSTSLPA